MKINTELAASRLLGVAKNLLNNPINESTLLSKKVVLTGEASVLKHDNGYWCFMNALRLLARMPVQLVVIIPSGLAELKDATEAYCSQKQPWGQPELLLLESTDHLQTADAILNVGTLIESNRPWTSINSNGWVARISSDTALPDDVHQPNPIAALMAASLGVSEIFKRIIEVPINIAPALTQQNFSLFDFATDSTNVGPVMPSQIAIPDSLLVGAGAIGNGIALLLSQLPVTGRLHIVDYQDFQTENLGTSVLVSMSDWCGHPKALTLAEWLNRNSQLESTGEKAKILDALEGTAINALKIDLVLNGLDKVSPRHDSQLSWPSVIVDGGINETGAAVVQHRLDDSGLACLRCTFEIHKEDLSELQSKLTGLRKESLANQDRVITDEDIERADSDKREWLRAMQSEHRAICSIISEAALLQRFGVSAEEGFRPSVPFVATAAAAMVVGQAIKALLFPDAPYKHKYQLGNLLLGAQSIAQSNRMANPSCVCTRHRSTINSLRQKRLKVSG